MKKLEVKFEIWADVEFDDSITTEEALEMISNCTTLGDLLDEGFSDYSILDGDICDCDLINDDRCVWVGKDDDTSDMYGWNDNEYIKSELLAKNLKNEKF